MGGGSYRACVVIVATDPGAGRVLWCERADHVGSWQFPQGGIHDGEEAVTAAFREAAEELGVAEWELVDVMPERVRYEFPPGVTKKGHRGQEQVVVLLRYCGPAARAEAIDPASVSRPEFARCRWVRPEAVDLDEVPRFKRHAVAQALGWAVARMEQLRRSV